MSVSSRRTASGDVFQWADIPELELFFEETSNSGGLSSFVDHTADGSCSSYDLGFTSLTSPSAPDDEVYFASSPGCPTESNYLNVEVTL